MLDNNNCYFSPIEKKEDMLVGGILTAVSFALFLCLMAIPVLLFSLNVLTVSGFRFAIIILMVGFVVVFVSVAFSCDYGKIEDAVHNWIMRHNISRRRACFEMLAMIVGVNDLSLYLVYSRKDGQWFMPEKMEDKIAEFLNREEINNFLKLLLEYLWPSQMRAKEYKYFRLESFAKFYFKLAVPSEKNYSQLAKQVRARLFESLKANEDGVTIKRVKELTELVERGKRYGIEIFKSLKVTSKVILNGKQIVVTFKGFPPEEPSEIRLMVKSEEGDVK